MSIAEALPMLQLSAFYCPMHFLSCQTHVPVCYNQGYRTSLKNILKSMYSIIDRGTECTSVFMWMTHGHGIT